MLTKINPCSGMAMDLVHLMEEKRKCERFLLRLPTSLLVLESNNPPVDAVTENISAAGAFFLTDQPLPEGLKVLVELTLMRESGEGGASRVKVVGTVLPSRPNGMAVCFDKRVQMLPY